MNEKIQCGGLIERSPLCLVEVMGFDWRQGQACGILGKFGKAGISLSYLSVGNGADGAKNMSFCLSTEELARDRHLIEEIKTEFKPDKRLNTLLAEALEAASGDDGWATLSVLGSNLSRMASDFDPRTWGYTKLKDLMAAHPDYLVQSRPTKDGKNPVAQVRRRSRRRGSARA